MLNSLRNQNRKSDINVYLKNGVHDSSDLYKIRDILIAHPGSD